MSTVPRGQGHVVAGHLEYYLQHGLNPVCYDMANPAWHFQRRASLYRSLGVHPLTVRGARVLEVAAGTGQNSLYLASLRPRHFTLVEPNPLGVRDIKALYGRPEFAAWRPELFEGKFEDFQPRESYDLAVCENWLGQGAADQALLRKLGGLVAPGGLLVVTAVAPVGILPNVLRKLLAVRLGCWERCFEDATHVLVEAFGPHLATMAGMTRTVTDWVHDNLLNPHYFNICLTVPMVAEHLGRSFSFVGASPSFAVDWRWFKTLYGDARDFNGHFLAEYLSNCHNFLDYRRVLPPGDLECNRALEAAAWQLIEAAAEADRAARIAGSCPATADDLVLSRLRDVAARVEAYVKEDAVPLREFEEIYRLPRVGPEQVAGMRAFAGLFGRETVYVALGKNE